MNFRPILLLALTILVAPLPARAQVALVPSERSPYRQKFDLQLLDAQYFFTPQGALPAAEGPLRFVFENLLLNEVLEQPSTVRYVTERDGGILLQLFHLRVREVPEEVLGPQAFRVVDGSDAVLGQGTILVLGRLPEPMDLMGEEGTRVFEVGRASDVVVRVRSNANWLGSVRVLNGRDFELLSVDEEPADSAGTIVLHARIRPHRQEASELRLVAETADGRSADLVFGGLAVRPAAPRRIRVLGGPIYLDAVGRGSAAIVVNDFSVAPVGTPEIVAEAGGDLIVMEQRWDPERRQIQARVELVSRSMRGSGAREVREIQVRGGDLQTYRGLIEVVGAPTISAVRTDQHARPILTVGDSPTLLRISGQNLDGLRLDCSPLGPGALCRTVGSSPTELVAEVTLEGDVRDGDSVLPLAGTEERRLPDGPVYPGGGIRVQVERPAIPLLLASPGLLAVDCGTGCRASRIPESMVVRSESALDLRLALEVDSIPPAHGWQRVTVTVTRVRGEQRQVVRTLGTAAVPRTYRQGQPAGSVPLLDASADPRHGDLFIVRVEHAAEQYPPEYRNVVAAGEPWVRRIYVDGGAHKRLTGDIAVQPVLFTVSNAEPGKRFNSLYPNAGLGVTWQFLNDRMEPRPVSAKLQILATDIRNVGGDSAAQPAIFLSGNLRIPGTDPTKPLVVTTGLAHMLGGKNRWRLMAGAGMDLGVARLIFGG